MTLSLTSIPRVVAAMAIGIGPADTSIFLTQPCKCSNLND